MYGYRQSNENGLMTNLNSISSSLSSIDTVGRRNGNGIKASADNLITTLRSHSNTSTSLLWNKNHNNNNNNNNNKDNDRYSTAASLRNGGSRYQGSEIYYNGGTKPIKNYCPTPHTALHFILVPLLLLTITRQVFDFLGQLWLQIIVNFFTIIIIIVALFGIRQNRISYLVTFILWALLNTAWNLIVVCIHTKIRDVGLTEDFISLYTGTYSWWQSNGPGCLPYNISSIPPSISISLKPNIITGCRLDYHLIEATQAALHASLSLLASIFCCCVASAIRRNPAYFIRKAPKSEKLFRLNNLTSDRSKINHDPYPNHHDNTRFGPATGSIRRAANKTSSRSSQHSMSSVRSRHRRNRQISEGVVPTPRGSTSSAHRSQKYGSLSSRRSQKNRRGDMSSLTYGTTSGERVANANQRARLSSLSSADYLPSYQPPHSSSANLLSSYGEISSIDSYNNDNLRGSKYKRSSKPMATQGNTNPTYNGSRSSICSQNTNNNNNNVNNNYHSLSYIYGNNSRASESLYGGAGAASTSATANARDQSRQRQQQKLLQRQQDLNQTDRIYSGVYGSRGQQQQQIPASIPQEIQVETHQKSNGELSAITRAKLPLTNGGSFHSFSAANQRAKMIEQNEINNNNMISNHQHDTFDAGHQTNAKKGTFDPNNNSNNGNLNTFDNRYSRQGGINANGSSTLLGNN